MTLCFVCIMCVCRFGTKGELEGVLSEELMEKMIDELEKAQGGGEQPPNDMLPYHVMLLCPSPALP